MGRERGKGGREKERKRAQATTVRDTAIDLGDIFTRLCVCVRACLTVFECVCMCVCVHTCLMGSGTR